MENSTNRYTHLPGTPSRRRKVPLLWLCLLLATSSVSRAQSFTTSGTDFWVAMMPCWLDNDVDSYYLSASGPRSCSITIENPNTGWSHTMTIAAGGTTTYQLPNVQCWQAGSCIISNTGLHVTSTDTVQLWSYLSSQTASSCDASLILPSTNLGTHYIVQTTPVDHSYSQESHAQFSVLAIEDGTVVDMELTNSTSTGIASGSTITRTLNAGQVFQVQSPHQQGDFSGTTVRARDCKKIAVFSGASATNMPYESNTSSDETYHQNLPIAAYSTEWLLTPTAWHDTADYVRITSPSDNCQIYRNGNLLTTINAGQTYQFKLNAPAHVTTSHPAALYQYLDSRHNSSTGGDWGDVAMFAPNPINQTTKACTFPCLPVRSRPAATSKYYVNVVVPTAETALLKLDGNPLTGFSPFPGTNYSYIRQSITNSAHALTTTGSGFSAYTYGLGENWEAYAMSLGGTDTTITNSLVNLVTLDTSLCSNVFFWGSLILPVPGTYRLLQHNDTNSCDTLFFVTLTKIVSSRDTVDSALCANTILWGDTTLTVPGFHTLHYPAASGCDSIVCVNLSRKVTQLDTIDTAFCKRFVTWGDTTLAIPGSYTLHYPTAEGCDSVVHLNLDISYGYEITIDTSVCTSTFLWQDSTFEVPGDYILTYYASDECDSNVYLSLHLSEGYQDSIYDSSCVSPYQWQDTALDVPGNYVFHYTSSDGCDSTVHLELSASEGYETFFDTASCDNLILWMDTVFDVPGSYEVHLTASDGCDSTVHLKILYYPSYETFDTLRLHGEQLDTTINGQRYTIGDQFDRTLQTTLGCDSIIHTLLVGENCHPFIWIPNVFTPFQPTNNIFRIQSQNITEMTVSIYQRWGDCIHTFDGLTEGWNGTLRGQPCQEGAYVYLIRYKTTCTPKPKTLAGTVTILH